MKKTFNERLSDSITKLNSSLCVGIDPVLSEFPKEFKEQTKVDPKGAIEKFCRQIVISTAPFCSAFKPQVAMFSSIGCEHILERLSTWIVTNFPNHILIIDGKRGDIGNTAEHYAVEVFEKYNAHATTVNPYMGRDCLNSFLNRKDKGVFILCRTSNPSASEIQNLELKNGSFLFEKVAEIAKDLWKSNQQVGLVIGATAMEELKKIKKIAPLLPMLIPGVGSQGGLIEQVIPEIKEKNNVLINVSRSIIYSSMESNWKDMAAYEAENFNNKINQLKI